MHVHWCALITWVKQRASLAGTPVAPETFFLRRLHSRNIPVPPVFPSSVSVLCFLTICTGFYREVLQTIEDIDKPCFRCEFEVLWRDILHVLSWVSCRSSGGLVIKYRCFVSIESFHLQASSCSDLIITSMLESLKFLRDFLLKVSHSASGYLVRALLVLYHLKAFLQTRLHVFNEQPAFSVALIRLLETLIIVSLNEKYQFPKGMFHCVFHEAQ